VWGVNLSAAQHFPRVVFSSGCTKAMRALAMNEESAIAIKTIQEAIASLEVKASEIRVLVYANPSADIIELRKAVDKRIEETGYANSLDFIAESIQKERKLLWMIKQQKRKTPKLVLELIDVDMQIDDLKKELSSLLHPAIVHR
jgi:hypothetical protein